VTAIHWLRRSVRWLGIPVAGTLVGIFVTLAVTGTLAELFPGPGSLGYQLVRVKRDAAKEELITVASVRADVRGIDTTSLMLVLRPASRLGFVHQKKELPGGPRSGTLMRFDSTILRTTS
jgi:hypothetical protein